LSHGGVLAASITVLVVLGILLGRRTSVALIKCDLVPETDPWARDRGAYYTLDWKARKGAESDPAFGN
jgi:hypothetical protein